MRKQFCQACSFARNGVKTRKAIPHTCGKGPAYPKFKHEYIPTREELDLYIKRLRELMEEPPNNSV